jgi:glutaredoxin
MRALLVALVSVCIASQAAAAAEHNPKVYYFWSASCSYCQAARLFLDKAQATDAKIKVRDFEVEDNLNNAILLSRVYERIGIPDFSVVPLFVIGTHVVIGFDDAAGREILDSISDCRKRECRDIVHDLIRAPDEVEQAALAPFIAPPRCARNASDIVRPPAPAAPVGSIG